MQAKNTFFGLLAVLFVLLISVQNVQAQQWTGSSTKTGGIYREGGVEVHAGGDVYLKAGYGMAGIKLSETPGHAQVRFRSSHAGGYNDSPANDFVFEIGRYQGHGSNVGTGTEVFRLGYDKAYIRGNVGIGTSSPGSFKLAVNGTIRAKEIRVNTGWSDFVFEEDYRLPTLSEVESHIKEKKHLPGIPSAAEVETEGVELGVISSKLLQKVEELTLYVIAQEKQIAEQQARIEMLEKLLIDADSSKPSR